MYRQKLEARVRQILVRSLAAKLREFKPYDPIYKLIVQDIRTVLLYDR